MFGPISECDGYQYTQNTDLMFSWTPASGNVDHYNVYVSYNDAEFVLIDTTDTNSYMIVGVHPFTKVKMKVEAENAAGCGPMSDPSVDVIVLPDSPTRTKWK